MTSRWVHTGYRADGRPVLRWVAHAALFYWE